MEYVNYEERYPTVVSNHYTAQPYPQVVQNDNPKYSLIDQNNYKEASVAIAESYPELDTPDDSETCYKPAEGTGPTGVGTRRYCGISKKTFLFALILALVLIFAAVGGAVGGVLGGEDKKETTNESASSNTASQTSSSTSTKTSSTPTSSVTSTSLATALNTSEPIGSLGVSVFQDTDDQVYFHLYHQQGSNLGYRVYNGVGAFSDPKSLDLTTAPKANTPLSAVETYSSGKSYMQLFYLDGDNNIIIAVYSSILGSYTLTLDTTAQVVASSDVHASSQLAAIYLGDEYGYRLYYQSPSGELQEKIGQNSTWSTSAAVSSAIANGGSPLTITSIETPQMNLFYVDSTTKTLFNVAYNEEWQTPAALSNTTIDAWDGDNTALAAVAQTNSTTLRTYYIGSNYKVYEMQDVGAETNWTTDSDRDVKWPSADFTAAGGLVGLAWEDSVRLYYVSNSSVEQLGLDMTGGIAGIWFEQSY